MLSIVNLKATIGFLAFLTIVLPSSSQADSGNQFCITPPFITAGIKPNLLLMIDNSASMYDLAYQDAGNKYCANGPTTLCTADAQCATAGQAYCVGSYVTTAATTTKAACNTDADCRAIPGFPTDTCVLTGPKSGRNVCTAATVISPATISPIACSSDTDCSGAAAAGVTWIAGDTCNNRCNASRQCYDTTYATATTYYGYFDPAAIYSYTANNFASGATMPATCTYTAGTPAYFCVNTTGTGSAETVVANSTGFVASGNFLNWLTMSKFDVEKKILTGGKFDTTANQLISESRGCGGREFLKSVTGVNLTFAIRGGTSGGIASTQSLATEYGQTHIDIYAGVYNADACLQAMNNWINVVSGTPPNLGSFQNSTKSCLGAGTTVLNPTSMWNHSLHNCYQGMTPGTPSYSTNLNALENECKMVYASIPPNRLTDPNNGFSVCSSVLTYTVGGTSFSGYLGACWNGTDFTGPCKNPDGTAQTGMTDVTQMQNYCQVNVATTPIADPSSTSATNTTVSASIPGFVMQQGLAGLTNVGSFPVKVGAAAQTGLIDKYSDRIRFGAMTFQNNGTGSECGGTSSIPCVKTCSVTATRICYFDTDCPTGEKCGALAKADGGAIKAYVGAGFCSATTTFPCTVDSDCATQTPSGQYCKPSIGNHSTGLISSIDQIPATSWTPFAEAFYNAMGYFARSNNYGVSPPYSRDLNFSVLGPNTATSYVTDKNPSQFRCQSNNLLLITDGMSTADQHVDSEALATLYASQVPYTIGATTYRPGDTGYDPSNVHGATAACPSYSGSRSISDLAWVAKNRNIKTLTTSGTASTTTPQNSSESITTYVVYSGPQTSTQPGLCDPKTLMTNTATNGGTSLFSASDPASLYNQIDTAFSTVAAKAASGTAASILSNSEGSGANLLQAVFYPQKIFDGSTAVNWIGEMQNLWYYVDPYIQNSSIREDTVRDLKLNLVSDYVVRFPFDASSDKTMAQRYSDSDGDGVVTDSNKVGGLIDPDYVKSIWRAGALLWKRTSARTIYTGYNSTQDSTPVELTALNNATSGVWDALQIPAGTDTQRGALATKLIDYTLGTDQVDDTTAPCLNADCKYRPRKVTMSVCSDSNVRCSTAADCSSGATCDSYNQEWKLGDIISSTPRIQSTIRLNTYDLPSPGGYSDKTYEAYVNSNQYQGRGKVYVGANDGMLHAFNLGKLSVKSTGFQKAQLTPITGESLGDEQWAFIPKNSLPYLKYATDKGYSHLYYVDGRTVVFDASIGDTNTGTCIPSSYWECSKPRNGSIPFVDSSNNLDATKNTWRTIVIGGMGVGGASRNNVSGEICTEGASGNCVKTPISGIGYSSYFALDVTDPNNPKFLWEFSNNLLGYSTTAPAIVRIGDKDKNGRWFAVFGNGPFGPIDPGSHQFMGESTHHLRYFVVDLRSGTLLRTITFNGLDAPNIDDAFAGTLLGGSIDADRRDPSNAGNYQDDAIYSGYVTLGTDGKWTNGGVVRVMTKEDQDPTHWAGSKVIEGIGPVTTSIARTQDTRALNKNLWLYFGTGRYYYRDSSTLDDNDNRRALLGIQEPCYNTATRPGNVLDGTCTATVTAGSLVNQTSSVSTLGATDKGWRIDLDTVTASEGAERVVTDTVALTNGTVFFTSFKPTMDVCGYGGNSFLWGVKYDTGGQAASNALKGKALIQLSTGEFSEVDLSSAFTDKLNRRMTSPMTGKPPSDAPPVISSSLNKPVKKILHIREH
ncbi:PilC/PilY family type IV pilus protein [Geotalea sp. SG265]|uniref:pilus assembly protein n=1 Tax=Geotalea sp. SG265 TaxID=2922867 RepID=UPI001FAF74ED|nr:PilC/PilY family type IV pilus protein [Geotalea sp. SG265]